MKLPKLFSIFSLSLRASYRLAILLAVLFFAGSIALQVYVGVVPNVFLYVERGTMLLSLLFFVTWSLITHTPRSKKICAILSMVVAVFGVLVSMRHVLLQRHPVSVVPAAPVTGSHWDGALQVLWRLYYGDPSASQVGWMAFGHSLAFWTGIFFVALLVLSLMQVSKKLKG